VRFELLEFVVVSLLSLGRSVPFWVLVGVGSVSWICCSALLGVVFELVGESFAAAVGVVAEWVVSGPGEVGVVCAGCSVGVRVFVRVW
jgi:hypothetical protein